MANERSVSIALVGVALGIFGLSISLIGLAIIQAGGTNFNFYVPLGALVASLGVVVALVAASLAKSTRT